MYFWPKCLWGYMLGVVLHRHNGNFSNFSWGCFGRNFGGPCSIGGILANPPNIPDARFIDQLIANNNNNNVAMRLANVDKCLYLAIRWSLLHNALLVE